MAMRMPLLAVLALVLCAPAWGARTLRVFGPAGFEDGDPRNDCPVDAISPSALEAKFLRRTSATVVCMPPSATICFNNDCGGNPGCFVPIGPPISAVYAINQDRVDTADRVGGFTFPAILPVVGTCNVTINPGPADIIVRVSHNYDVQNFGLDGLGVVSHVNDATFSITGLIPEMVTLSGSFMCLLANIGVAFFVDALQDGLASPVLDLQHTEASDVPGSVVCPVTQP